MKPRLLLVACAAEILHSLSVHLAATGHRVQFAASGLELLKKARRRLPDLIILGGTLPDLDGTTVCEILSRLPSTTAVPRILLAPPAATFSKTPAVSAITGGVAAPRFNSEELIRRVHELLGHPGPPPGGLADEDLPGPPDISCFWGDSAASRAAGRASADRITTAGD